MKKETRHREGAANFCRLIIGTRATSLAPWVRLQLVLRQDQGAKTGGACSLRGRRLVSGALGRSQHPMGGLKWSARRLRRRPDG